VIEPANPAFIYPPAYNPSVYGPWPYPDYPPLDIASPDYGIGFAPPFGIGFGVGFAVFNHCGAGAHSIGVSVEFSWTSGSSIRSTITESEPEQE
jgi:hypothetical protein